MYIHVYIIIIIHVYVYNVHVLQESHQKMTALSYNIGYTVQGEQMHVQNSREGGSNKHKESPY